MGWSVNYLRGVCLSHIWRTGDYEFSYPGKKNGLGKNKVGPYGRLSMENAAYDDSFVINLLQTTWRSYFTPGTMTTIDECRINANQNKDDNPQLSYNSTKPDKWAVEVITLHDTESKYLYGFIPTKTETPFDAAIELASLLKQTGQPHHITFDSRFVNLAQIEKLEEMGLYGTGCCRTKFNPTSLWKYLIYGLPKYNSSIARQGVIVGATYNRKSQVNILTNWFKVREARKKGECLVEDRNRILNTYDDNKRSCDQFNLMVSTYHFTHKHESIESAKLVGYIEWGIQNAFICYKDNVKNPLSHQHFLLSISKSLLLKVY